MFVYFFYYFILFCRCFYNFEFCASKIIKYRFRSFKRSSDYIPLNKTIWDKNLMLGDNIFIFYRYILPITELFACKKA